MIAGLAPGANPTNHFGIYNYNASASGNVEEYVFVFKAHQATQDCRIGSKFVRLKKTHFPLLQVIFDSGSRGYWLNELFLLLHSDVDTCLKLQCADTLFTALDNCRDIVQVGHILNFTPRDTL
jgi:hypothetical protein